MNTVATYKLTRYSRKKFYLRVGLWLCVLAGIIFAKPIYEFLFSRNLTQTEPLSLFDVIQITGIIFVLFIATRSRSKIETLERRVQDLHQELSIRLANTKPRNKD